MVELSQEREADESASAQPLPTDDDSGSAHASEVTASVPLYISGCLGTLAAVGAVMQNLGPDALGFATGLLAILGYVVSFSYRRTRLSPRLLNAIIGFVVALLVVSLLTGRISIGLLEPATQSSADLQLAVALQWLAVLYTWALTDDRKVVTAAILAIATIGLVAATDVTPTLIGCFLVYVAATVFLLIHQNYLLHWNWGHSDMRRGSRRLLGVQLTLAAVCWVLAVLAGMVLVVPLQIIGAHLSLAGALRGLVFAGGGATETPQTATDVSVSDSKTFSIGQGGNGSEFSLSKQVIFHVYPSDSNAHYWRGDTYDVYTGQGWSSSLSVPQTPIAAINRDIKRRMTDYYVPPTLGDLPADVFSGGKASLMTYYELVSGTTDTLYLPSRSFAVSVPRPYQLSAQYSQDGHIQLPESLSRIAYSSSSLTDDASPNELRSQLPGLSVPPHLRSLYINQLANSASPADQRRLAAQAKQIIDALPASQHDEYDEANAIRGWVSDRAQYSLDVSPTPPGQDAVSYFLYTSRMGYCDLYASSMTLLCRYAGIPARVATGFAPGVGRAGGGYDLRAIDKHAWCQVYFPSYGWFDFDPTSGTRMAPKQTPWVKLTHSLKAAIAAISQLYRRGGPVPALLTLAILGGFLYIVATEGANRLRARRSANSLAKADVAEANRQGRDAALARANAERRWQAARQELRRWNLKQKPSETAREFALRAGNAAAELSRRAAGQAADDAAPGNDDSRQAAGQEATTLALQQDPEAMAQALEQLAKSFTAARYAERDDALLQSLLDTDESGAGERELTEVRRFVAWSKPLAKELAERSA